MVRVIIESRSQQEITDWAIRYLSDLGYAVSPSEPIGETAEELARRLNLSRRHVLRRLAHPGCPRVRIIRSPAQRISLIFATPQLEAFLKTRLRN
jgi:hypothetical protein